MKRSGNHVVARWVQAQTKSCFKNNFIPISAILRGEKKLPEPRRFKHWLRKHREKVGCSNRLHLISLEDIPIDIYPFRELPRLEILVLRNPFMMFASRVRKGSISRRIAYPADFNEQMKSHVSLWKSYALKALEGGRTRVIIFDLFVSNWLYPRMVARDLSVPFSAPDLSRIEPFGGGSSFSGTKQLDESDLVSGVLSRVDELSNKEREVIENIIGDEELTNLWGKLLESVGQ